MISYEEAIEVLQSQEKLTSTILEVNEACGYIAAQDVVSDVTVPPFANSAMDGFAVRSADLKNLPVTLPLVGSTVAGDTPSKGDGGAWEIMTGATVPEGYDAVVKIEDVSIDGDKITFTEAVSGKNNIREAGEDIVPNDVIIKTGEMITPFHIMALTTIGQKEIAVASKPRITIFTTGKEIIDDADTELQAGQIRNSNSPYLLAELNQGDYNTSYAGIIHDEPEVFEEKVQQALADSDIIISTGAVSAGKHDFIPDSLRKLGAEILFHKVAIRPGKPVLYAKFPDGTHYFGLPGNPVSAAVGLRFFVQPLLRHLQNSKAEKPITARLLMPYPKKKKLRFFYKAYVSVIGGKLQMEILKGQESFKIQPLLKANCWATFGEEQTGQEVGEAIDIYPLTPNKWNLESGI